jgi:hypothetical protein
MIFSLLEISHSIICGHKFKKKLLDVYLYAQEGSRTFCLDCGLVGEDLSKFECMIIE